MTERWHPDERLPVIARFEVRRRAYLAPDGSINRQLLAFASDTRLLVRLYRAMVLVRAFDMKAVALQRTGRLGTYAASLGQEAVSVGTASAMRNEDVLLPSYRDNAALIWRGRVLLFWGGDERGNCFSGPVQEFPFCIPVGSEAPPRCGRRLRLQGARGVCTENLNTGVVVMKSAQHGARAYATDALNRARNWRILVQGSMRSDASALRFHDWRCAPLPMALALPLKQLIYHEPRRSR